MFRKLIRFFTYRYLSFFRVRRCCILASLTHVRVSLRTAAWYMPLAVLTKYSYDSMDRDVLTLIAKAQQSSVKDAINYYQQALKLLDESYKNNNLNESEWFKRTSFIFCRLADLTFTNNDLRTAEEFYKEGIRRAFSAGLMNGNSPAFIELTIKLSSIYAIRQQFDLAEEGFLYALKVMRASDLSSKDNLALLGMALDAYGRLLLDQKQFKQAGDLLSESLDICNKLFGLEHDQTLVVQNNLAKAFAETGKFHEALCLIDSSLANCQPQSSDYIVYLVNKATVLSMAASLSKRKGDVKKFETLKADCKNVIELARKHNEKLKSTELEQMIKNLASGL